MEREALETLLSARDGTAICVHTWSVAREASPARALICVQGLGGHGGYYDVLAQAPELADTLIIAPDLRGHGRSQGVRGDIASFALYLDDLESTVAWVHACWPRLPLILLGESMGASIAIQYLCSAEPHASQISALALVSPVLGAAIKPRLDEALRYLRLLLCAPTRPAMAVTGREELGCRDAAFNQRLRDDPLFVRHVSVRFLNRLSFWLTSARRKAPALKVPLLLLQGSHDAIAHARGTRSFLRHLGSREVRVITFAGAYHSLLHDPATPAVLEALQSWLEELTFSAGQPQVSRAR